MLQLKESSLIFRGVSRDVYKLDEHWSIKIVTKKGEQDNINVIELDNYKKLKLTSLVDYIPMFQDKLIETNLGLGICCQLVGDFDGFISKSLFDFCQENKLNEDIKRQFDSFFSLCEKNFFFFYDFNAHNFLIQKCSLNNYKIKFIDIKGFNRGKTFFNLEKWIVFFAKQKFKRRKNRFYDKWLRKK